MLRFLILASLCTIISSSIIPNYILDYPQSLRHLFGVKREANTKGEKDDREVCQTDECKLIANVIKESMDESVDPCDDFYEYACGNWSNINPIPENMTEWSLWTMVSTKVQDQIKEIITAKTKPDDFFAVKLARKWYHSCMDTEAIERRGVEPILSTLWRHGGWPLIMEEGEWDDKVYNWQIVDDHFARLIGFNAFHDVRYGRASYEDNDTILIETPHMPFGAFRLLANKMYSNSDSSDENNESGEGSQEKGSKEQPSDETDDETESEATGESDWETAEESEDNEEPEIERTTTREQYKGSRHARRSHTKNRNNNRHVGKTRKRSKRDILRHEVLHRSVHQLKTHKRSNRHSVKGSKDHHLSSSKHHLSNKNLQKHGNVKAHDRKVNHKRKRITEKDEEEKESQRKRKIARRKKTQKLGHGKRKSNKRNSLKKHVHQRKVKNTSNRIGSKSTVHVTDHQHHQKAVHHRVHHANKISRHGKVHLSNIEEDTDNDENNTIDVDDSTDEGTDNDETSNDEQNEDKEEQTEEEEDDNNDGDDEEENEEKGDDGNDGDYVDDDEEDKDNDDTDGDDDEDEEANRLKFKEMYKEYILNVSLLLSKGRGIEIPKEQMLQDIDDLIEFVIKLGDLILADEEPEPLTLNGLQELYDELEPSTDETKINWVRKVQKLFLEAGVEIDSDVQIMASLEYIKNLHTLLNETSRRVIVNYIHWLYISKAVLAGPSELRELSDNWQQMFLFSTRESECLELVQLTNIVGYQYVKQFFSENIANSARDMIDDIQKEVEYQIKGSKWMNNDTKHFVLDKLVHMKNWIGYPDWYENATIVKRYFRGLTIGPSFYENLLNYVRYTRWKSLRRVLNESTDAEVENMLDPLMLNAFFMPTENSISITAVDFQSPLFAHNRPWYVNFGVIGLVMGHEVNHGFDDSGHLYDKEGNHIEWLSAMADAYNKRAECFVDQYNKYSIIKGENFTIEDYGNQTAGENIADSMGLQAVYRAYKRRERECGKPDPALPGLEKFSNDQAFFLSFANLWCETVDRESLITAAKYDVHSPGRLRVIGPASNSEAFAKAFNCPVGSPMNPKKKCNIWE